jgi:glycosyltransferase involved in cell wall biosynthesis
MQDIYNSADFFLQASRREFSGCALIEAMACGVIPVASDIPAFRAMTDGGRVARLFAVGDADALATAALSVQRTEIDALAREVRQHFSAALSYRAMAITLDRLYAEVVGQRQSATPTTIAPTTRLANRA